MDKTELTPELEKLVKGVKLKEPPEQLMADYLSGVNAKIDRGAEGAHFGFPQIAIVLAIGLTFAGAFYLFLTRPQGESPVQVAEITQKVETTPLSAELSGAAAKIEPLQPLSLEEEMEVLEAFGEEFQGEASDLFGDEEVFEELAQLDELELSPTLSTPTSSV
ncbi:MAG: hypothetical protein HY584_04920 [Candidatus Omnitrophica bacterium]|nr:hypothetical protein [Candidatus Omnitrophota bacterium]